MYKLSKDGVFPYICLALVCVTLTAVLHFGQKELFYNKTVLTMIGIVPFPTMELEARSAIIYDPNTGKVLFEKDSDTPRPLASLTKVMTALVSADLLGSGDEVDIQRQIIIPATTTATSSPEATSTPSVEGLATSTGTTTDEATITLNINERWRAGDLSQVMLVSSSNEAANALAGEATTRSGENFVQAMNDKAKELGLQTVVFRNPSGLDVSAEMSGASGSAKDIAKLFSYILENKLSAFDVTKKWAITRQTIDGQPLTAQNTNRVLDQIPGLYFSKTGLTTLAGGNLAVAYDAGLGHPLVAVVLGSSESGRFTDMVKLVNASVEYLAQKKP